jgi:diguanylate cyclase (GGDEF)-like protein
MIEFEEVRTLLVAAVALSLAATTLLLWRNRRQIRPSHRGFDAVLVGLALVSAAALMDAADVESVVAEKSSWTVEFVVLQLVVGYLGGILCIGVGLSLWVPALVTARREEERRREAEDALLTSRVESSTLHLASEIVRRLHNLTDPTSIAEEAVQVMVRQIGAPRVAFHLLDEDRQWLRLEAEHSFDRDVLEVGSVLPVQGSLSGEAVRVQDVVVCTDITRDERLVPAVRKALEDSAFSSATIIPLVGADSVLGTINLLFREPSDPTPTELDTFRAIGQMVALAIENARNRADLEHRARHDLLTGLENRFGLRTLLDDCLRSPKATVCLIVFDVVRLMEINDALGYGIGDQLLREIANRLRATEGGIIQDAARLGADKFAAVCTNFTSVCDVEHRAEQLLEDLTRPYYFQGFELAIGLAVGIAVAPDDGRTSVDLIRSGELALRNSKRKGGGIVRYHAEMVRTSPESLEITSSVRGAIADNQLLLHYQPKYQLGTGRLVGFEALLRWQHPTRGLLQPRDFIPLAEMTDSIQPMTRWVMHTALQQLAMWQQHHRHLTMAVNLSARNLNGRDCGAALREVALDAGVALENVIVELTETALTLDSTAAVHALNRITAAGARLAIDDFGTGYSSLSHLTRYPVHSLKIDRSFVTTMLDNERSRAIIRSTIAMARDLGLVTVAEGVESDVIASELQNMGCDQAQGFALGRPLPPAEAEHMLARIAN